MGLSFSQRHGYKPASKIIQMESLDRETRSGIWNVIQPIFAYRNDKLSRFLWSSYFKQPQDTHPTVAHTFQPAEAFYRYYYNYVLQTAAWNECFDFIEVIVKLQEYLHGNELLNRNCNLVEMFNQVFENDAVGYRFVDDIITPITNELELNEIDEAIDNPSASVQKHLENALAKLSDRASPDYPNSVKESMSAVESMCCIVSGKTSATLGEALKIVGEKRQLHPALKDAMDKLYGYTSDAGGIRHGKINCADVNFELAKFILVTCSAFVNYLKPIK